jgi:hypothetical protein
VANLKDLREDSWLVISARIGSGEHPLKDHLAAALRRGEAVPPQVQAYLADLLEGRLDRRGRPRKSKKKWSGASLLWLIMSMDDLVEHYESRANKPVQSALSDLGTKYNLDPDSLNVYLKDARKLMEISDAALALEVNDGRERLQSQGAADPLNSALELTASKMGLPLGFIRRRYERGKRYVRKHVEDAPEFK